MAGSTLESAANEVGVDPRTVQRWKKRPDGDDRRVGPHKKPDNALTRVEREKILAVANSREFRDKSPHQIVAILADRNEYIASESSFYRVLREAKQLAHRGRARPRTPRPVPVHTATGAHQLVWWDITYLPTVIRGQYFFLYLFLDVWSRKIVGWECTIARTTRSRPASWRGWLRRSEASPAWCCTRTAGGVGSHRHRARRVRSAVKPGVPGDGACPRLILTENLLLRAHAVLHINRGERPELGSQVAELRLNVMLGGRVRGLMRRDALHVLLPG